MKCNKSNTAKPGLFYNNLTDFKYHKKNLFKRYWFHSTWTTQFLLTSSSWTDHAYCRARGISWLLPICHWSKSRWSCRQGKDTGCLAGLLRGGALWVVGWESGQDVLYLCDCFLACRGCGRGCRQDVRLQQRQRCRTITLCRSDCSGGCWILRRRGRNKLHCRRCLECASQN